MFVVWRHKMDKTEETDNLLDKNVKAESCLCATLVCSVIALIVVIVVAVVTVVLTPIGIVGRGRANIHLQYIYQGVVPSAETQNVVFSAFQTWTEYIYALETPYHLENGTYCDGLATIEDSMTYAGILFVVEFAGVDGLGGVIAFAGPCRTDANGIPRLGVIVVDTADVSSLMDIGEYLLEEVIMHEIAHVLGFGTLWVPNVTYDVPSPSPGAGYLYKLQNANEAHLSYGGTGSGARVEDSGGSGTAGSHWKEGVYGNELMTGFLDIDGGLNILSRVTLGGLEDIGYEINHNHPDLYSLPARRRLRPAGHARIYHVNDSYNFLHN